MDDLLLVCVVDRSRQGLSEGSRVSGKQGRPGQLGHQAAAGQVLQHDERRWGRGVEVMNLDDVGVLQSCNKLGFLPEAVQFLGAGEWGADGLDGHQSVK